MNSFVNRIAHKVILKSAVQEARDGKVGRYFCMLKPKLAGICGACAGMNRSSARLATDRCGYGQDVQGVNAH
jgi:hypothetical protein